MLILARPVRSMPISLRKWSAEVFIFLAVSASTSLTMVFLLINPRADGLAHDGPPDVAALAQGEDEDGHAVVAAERNGRRVHDLEVLLEDVDVADGLEPLGRLVGDRVRRVDAVDLGRLEDDFGPDLEGALGGGREDDDAALLHVPDDPPADERLGHGLDLDGRDVARVGPGLVEGRLQGDAVDDGGQHAHLVGRALVDAVLDAPGAAEEIAAADHDGDVDAEIVDFLDLAGDGDGPLEIDAGGDVAEEGFARDLEQDALVGRLGCGHRLRLRAVFYTRSGRDFNLGRSRSARTVRS